MITLLTSDQIQNAIRANAKYLKNYKCPYNPLENSPIRTRHLISCTSSPKYWCCKDAFIGIACKEHKKELFYKAIRELDPQELFVLRMFL